MIENCGNCRFYKPEPMQRGQGACHAGPPSPLVLGNTLIGAFAPTTPREWCGAHKPLVNAIKTSDVALDKVPA